MKASSSSKASPPKRKPGRPRSIRSEEAIINAAMKLLSNEGYAGVTLSKVAAKARTSKATIYRRWPTKEHLIVEAFKRWPTLAPHDCGNVLEDLLDLHRQFLQVLHRPPVNGIMPTLVAERAHSPALAAVFDPLMQRRRDPIRFLLVRAVERGELPRDTDIEMAIDLLMGVVVLRMYFVPGDLSEKAMRKLYPVMLRGLGAKGY
jgi:AcrR family transcriptional regulator